MRYNRYIPKIKEAYLCQDRSDAEEFVFCRKMTPLIRQTAEITSLLYLFLDEYEVIRLVDLEEKHMNNVLHNGYIRSTVQEIYESARRKLAACLVYGENSYFPAEITAFVAAKSMKAAAAVADSCFGKVKMCKTAQKGDQIMKIAVTYEDRQIFQHFGHTEKFKIYDIKEGKLKTHRLLTLTAVTWCFGKLF